MAIDTAQKRASAGSLFPGLPITQTPDAAKDQAWRQDAGWGYVGLLVSAPPAILPAQLEISDVEVYSLIISDVLLVTVLTIGDESAAILTISDSIEL